jgi:hypothetical protein
MSYSIYLDDIREPKNEFDKIVRSFEEAVACIEQNGMPRYVSFDHDLGCDEKGMELKSGYDLAKWLVEQSLDEVLSFPDDFAFNVHSANPIGKNNIEAILNNYLHFKITQEL